MYLLILVRHKVNAERELIDGSLLAAQVEDANLGIGDTTIVPRLGIRLVLAIAIATSRAATHSEENVRMEGS